MVAAILLVGLACPAAAGSQGRPAPWRLTVAAGVEGASAPGRAFADTSYWTNGPTIALGAFRTLGGGSFLSFSAARTASNGNGGLCADSDPPQCLFDASAYSTSVALGGEWKLFTLEAGGGWSGLRQPRATHPKWLITGPTIQAAAGVRTPSLFRVHGFITLRETRWVLRAPDRPLSTASIGLAWR